MASMSSCLLTFARRPRLDVLARDDAEILQEFDEIVFRQKGIQHQAPRGERVPIDLVEQGAARAAGISP